RRAPVLSWFLAAGAVAAAIVRVRGADLLVHFGIVAACAALLAVGSWVERFVFRLRALGPAPVHSIATGQAALLVYFYGRSAVSHGLHVPGVRSWELYALGTAAAVHLLLRRTGAAEGHPARSAA